MSLNNESLICLKEKIKLLNNEEKIELLYSIDDDSIKKEILLTLSDMDKVKYLDTLFVEYFISQVIMTIKDNNIKKLGFEKAKEIHIRMKNGLKLKEIFDKDKSLILKKGFMINNIDSDIDSKVKFGVEIEAVNSVSNYIINYGGDFFNRWDNKLDLSLPYNSIEIVSPVLNYKLDDLIEIYLICEFLKENNINVDERCAFHTHIDRNYLSNDKKYLFYLIYTYYEEIFYLITNEEGNLPRSYISEYSKPISDKFYKIERSIDGKYVIDEIKSEIQGYRKNYCINVVSPKGYNTIEFRMANGTLNADSIHQNIKLYIKFIDFVNRNNFDIINIIKDMSDEERLIFLLNQIFSKEEDKIYFYNRYISNKKLLNNESIYQRYFRR